MFRFVILGAGKIAVNFVEAVKMAGGCEVTAVASKSLERAQAFGEKCGVPRAYGSYEELLEKEEVDCAYIATVPSSHYEITEMCLKRRVPVLCEKAMFRNTVEAEAAFHLAREKNTFLMEALWSKFLPANVQARAWIRDGRIGEPLFSDAAFGFLAPKDPGNRYYDPALGGGAALDLTVYPYQMTAFLLDCEPRISSVLVNRAETGVDVSETVLMRVGSCLCTARGSLLVSLRDGATVIGEKGRIVIPIAHAASEAFLYNAAGNLVEHFRDEQTKNGFVYEIREVVKCVGEGRIESPVQTHAMTLSCARLFDQIQSALQGHGENP